MKCCVAHLIWLFLISSADAAMQYSKPIELAGLGGEELVAVPLDGEVVATVRDGFPDVRIVDGSNEEVAYILRKAQAKKSRKVKQTWEAEKLALEPGEDGSLQITFEVDLEKHPLPPQGIRLVTRLVNFEHRVRVETSADKETWEPLLEDALIFDYSQYMDVRNVGLDVDAKPQAAGKRYYRVTVENVTQEQQSQLQELTRHLRGGEETSRTEKVVVNRQPLRIDRIELWHDAMQQDVVGDREVDYPLAIDRVEQDPDARQTHVYLKSGREPLIQLTLVTPERNFQRAAQVEVPHTTPAATTWSTVGSGTLSRIDFRTLRKESLRVEIPEQRETAYRLVLANRDSKPLAIEGVTGQGNVYEVVFLARPDASYQLAYGSELAESPNYDTAALVAALAEGFDPLAGKLGAAVESSLPPDVVPWWSQILNSGPAMTALIGVLVVILGFGLYRATRQLE
jgi:hypothetical protein